MGSSPTGGSKVSSFLMKKICKYCNQVVIPLVIKNSSGEPEILENTYVHDTTQQEHKCDWDKYWLHGFDEEPECSDVCDAARK